MKIRYILFAISISLLGCGNGNHEADSYGNFSADEIIIAAETAGRILSMPYDEGHEVKAGMQAFAVDSMQAYLKLKELSARKDAAKAKLRNVETQIEVYEKQKSVLVKERNRFNKMLADGAATPKQIDDFDGQIGIIDTQIKSIASNSLSINAEIKAIEAGLEQAKDMLNKTNPQFLTSGTILEKYAEIGEMANPGKAIYKLANMDTMKLTAYISGNQLSAIQLGQKVTVSIDNPDGSLKDYKGTISWISPQAEFTPKNIQTREERLSQVYALRILVPNDGAIKINMPGEVKF